MESSFEFSGFFFTGISTVAWVEGRIFIEKVFLLVLMRTKTASLVRKVGYGERGEVYLERLFVE